MTQKKNIMYDAGHKSNEQILMDYIDEKGYKVKTEPFTTNMGINEKGVLINRGEFITQATFYNHEGQLKSCRIIPSLNAIFEGETLVREL